MIHDPCNSCLNKSGKFICDCCGPSTNYQNYQPILQGIEDDPVNHPSHYTQGKIECIDFIEDKNLNYHLGNAVKYIIRCEHKNNKKQDLEKAIWYIRREIEKCERKGLL